VRASSDGLRRCSAARTAGGRACGRVRGRSSAGSARKQKERERAAGQGGREVGDWRASARRGAPRCRRAHEPDRQARAAAAARRVEAAHAAGAPCPGRPVQQRCCRAAPARRATPNAPRLRVAARRWVLASIRARKRAWQRRRRGARRSNSLRVFSSFATRTLSQCVDDAPRANACGRGRFRLRAVARSRRRAARARARRRRRREGRARGRASPGAPGPGTPPHAGALARKKRSWAELLAPPRGAARAACRVRARRRARQAQPAACSRTARAQLKRCVRRRNTQRTRSQRAGACACVTTHW
jgi:hypothetical protein